MECPDANLSSACNTDVYGKVALVIPECEVGIDKGIVVHLEEVVDGELMGPMRRYPGAPNDCHRQWPPQGAGAEAAAPPREP
jgi:hypothetical protein